MAQATVASPCQKRRPCRTGVAGAGLPSKGSAVTRMALMEARLMPLQRRSSGSRSKLAAPVPAVAALKAPALTACPAAVTSQAS